MPFSWSASSPELDGSGHIRHIDDSVDPRAPLIGPPASPRPGHDSPPTPPLSIPALVERHLHSRSLRPSLGRYQTLDGNSEDVDDEETDYPGPEGTDHSLPEEADHPGFEETDSPSRVRCCSMRLILMLAVILEFTVLIALVVVLIKHRKTNNNFLHIQNVDNDMSFLLICFSVLVPLALFAFSVVCWAGWRFLHSEERRMMRQNGATRDDGGRKGHLVGAGALSV